MTALLVTGWNDAAHATTIPSSILHSVAMAGSVDVRDMLDGGDVERATGGTVLSLTTDNISVSRG